jgi:hypothetical protein
LTLPAATDTLVGKATTDTLTNKTLTGAAMNGTLGATTPSTGAFTTVSATGNVTLGDASTDTLNVGNGDLIKDASGNVGIGTTSPAEKLSVAGAIRVHTASSAGFTSDSKGGLFDFVPGSNNVRVGYVPGTSGVNTGILTFVVGSGTTAATIDSSGNLLVGATSGTGRLVVADTATTQISIVAGSGTGFNARLYMECPGINAGGFGYVRSTSRLYAWNSVEDSGPYVVASGTSWTTNSDARLKTNVQNIGYGLDAVLALSPKEYEYKIDDGKKCLGFIAQDVITIIPELVDMPEDSREMMGIEYQAFIPVLVKAMQEQQAMIESLRQRLSAANL